MPTHTPPPVRPRVARRAATVAALCLTAPALLSAAPAPFAAPPATAQMATIASGAPYVRIGDKRRTGSESPVGAGLDLPPQGLYEGCAPETTGDVCAEHLAAIRAAGFHYVLNYSSWYGSPAAVLRYADAAAALGLQLIWPLNHPAWRGLGSLSATYPSLDDPSLGATYPSLGEDRAGLSNDEFTSLAVGLVADHPATWGFYIGDELPAAEVGQVRELSAAVRRLAPDKPQLYIARPGVARLAPFAPLADIAGADAYPIGSGDPPVSQAARSVRMVATAASVQTAMVLQAFSWSQYRPSSTPPHYPSGRRLQAMRDAAIRHANPAMILWYSYQDILRSDHPHQRWHDLTTAAFARSGDPFAIQPPAFRSRRQTRRSRRHQGRLRERAFPSAQRPDRQAHTPPPCQAAVRRASDERNSIPRARSETPD